MDKAIFDKKEKKMENGRKKKGKTRRLSVGFNLQSFALKSRIVAIRSCRTNSMELYIFGLYSKVLFRGLLVSATVTLVSLSTE